MLSLHLLTMFTFRKLYSLTIAVDAYCCSIVSIVEKNAQRNTTKDDKVY